MDENAMEGRCIPQETVIENVRLARAYVPFQIMCATFTPSSALAKGTIFPPLWDNYGKNMREERVFDDE
ncbi:MAG: spore coat associated protein CotJA [Oscillospiraceae bacterium]|nr:spore coat associated protein CotJA [Oscillospiraceae bacterium]